MWSRLNSFVFLLALIGVTGCYGHLCQFDDGFCGWTPSGNISWNINILADKENTVLAAEVHTTDATHATASGASTATLTSQIHYGSQTIKYSTLTFSYFMEGPSSLSVYASLGQDLDPMMLWSSEEQPIELGTGWKNAETSIPQAESFSVSFIAEVQPHVNALVGITNVSLVVGDADECAEEPCENAGICIDGDGYFTCLCTGGYRGTRCQIPPRLSPARLSSVQTMVNADAIQDSSNLTTIEPMVTNYTDFTTLMTTLLTNETATTWVGTTSYTEHFETTAPTTGNISYTEPTTIPNATTNAATTSAPTTVEEMTTNKTTTVFDQTTLTLDTTLAQTELVTLEITPLTTEIETTVPSTSELTTVSETSTSHLTTTSKAVEPRTTIKVTTRAPTTQRTTTLRTGTYPSEKPPSELTSGAKAGIAIGSLLFFACVLIVLYIMCYKRKHKTYNLDYIDQEFIMEYVNRGQTQKYTGYWKEQEITPKNSDNDDTTQNNVRNMDKKPAEAEGPPPYYINNALTIEEGSTHDASSESEEDTTREDETTFDHYSMEPLDMGELQMGGTERFI